MGEEEHSGRQGRVLVAMSGGVDSSVAALMLRDQGLDVTGVTLHLFDNEDLAVEAESSCCSLEDVEDAKDVARRLGFPHFTFNYKGVFGHDVIDRFCNGYLANRTPNPCIDCNRYVKFAALQRRRKELGFDYIATGHYARREYDEKTGRYLLKTGLDATKDQSYVLFHLTQDDLAHMLLPLGELTKREVRQLADAAGLVNAEKPDSQDICFAPDGDYLAFIRHWLAQGEQTHSLRNSSGEKNTSTRVHTNETNTPTTPSSVKNDSSESLRNGGEKLPSALQSGPVVDTQGNLLGEHNGLACYTLGQRKGLGIATGEPVYVCAKDLDTRTLVVGRAEDALVKTVRADDVNLISCEPEALAMPQRVMAKTHYRQKAQPAQARLVADESAVGKWVLEVTFDAPVRPCAPGQALVIYDGDIVIGGGTIMPATRAGDNANIPDFEKTISPIPANGEAVTIDFANLGDIVLSTSTFGEDGSAVTPDSSEAEIFKLSAGQ